MQRLLLIKCKCNTSLVISKIVGVLNFIYLFTKKLIFLTQSTHLKNKKKTVKLENNFNFDILITRILKDNMPEPLKKKYISLWLFEEK